MADDHAQRLADLERHARAYGQLRVALCFTNGLYGESAKTITGPWERTEPLEGPEHAVGVMALARLRNPVVVCGRSGLVGLDIDGPQGRALLERMFGRLPRTVTVQTGKGHHLYYRPPAGGPALAVFELSASGVKAWREKYLVAPPSLHETGRVYSFMLGRAPWEQELAELPLEAMEALRAAAEANRNGGARTRDERESGPPIREGERNETLFRNGCAMRRRGMGEEAIAAALQIENAARCEPPLTEAEVRRIAASAATYAPGVPPRTGVPGSGASWPSPIGAAARIGVAGDWLELVAPQTEADPSLMLVELLVVFGALAGRAPHATVSGTRHGVNEFVCAVGETGAGGRKGTAHDCVRQLFRLVEPDLGARYASGLGSGEGLIFHLRDPISGRRKQGDDYVNVELDAGVADKRALIREGEFATLLRVAGREGSILSTTLRNAWDGNDLQNLVKTSPVRASRPHVGALVNITPGELRSALTTVEVANGFGNRFLWALSRRSRVLPDGGHVDEGKLAALAGAVGTFLDYARSVDRLQRDGHARALWHAEYERLTTVSPNLVGAATARAEAHALRLSMIFALLDGQPVVGLAHLEAALEVWRYCAESARWIFGDALGNPDADRILEALQGAPAGLTRTEIRDVFDRNLSGDRIERALVELLGLGLVRCELEATGGRPAERWFTE